MGLIIIQRRLTQCHGMGKREKAPATLKNTQKAGPWKGQQIAELKCKCTSELAQGGKRIFPEQQKSAKDTLIDVNFLIPILQNLQENNKVPKIRNCSCQCNATP